MPLKAGRELLPTGLLYLIAVPPDERLRLGVLYIRQSDAATYFKGRGRQQRPEPSSLERRIVPVQELPQRRRNTYRH
jgi:hypothetical protein